jgi:hypothetical protein
MGCRMSFEREKEVAEYCHRHKGLMNRGLRGSWSKDGIKNNVQSGSQSGPEEVLFGSRWVLLGSFGGPGKVLEGPGNSKRVAFEIRVDRDDAS